MMKLYTRFLVNKMLVAVMLLLAAQQLSAQNASPVDIPNLLVWLKADSLVTLGSGTQVAAWGDGGGTIADDVSQATAAARPDFIADAGPLMNNKPVLRFGGGTDELFGGTIAGAIDSSLSVYIVANSTDIGTNFPGLVSMGAANNGYVLYRVVTNSIFTVDHANSNTGRIQAGANSMPAIHPFRIYSAIKQFGVIHKLYINGDSVGASTTTAARNAFTNGVFRVGKTAGYGSWRGDIAEVIIFGRALTVQQRQVLENYINNKYAPPVSLGPDIVQTVNLCPVTLRAGNRFVSYLWSNGSTADSIRVNKSGQYWVRATNVFGKVSIDTINVTVPFSGINVRDTLLCQGNSVSLQPNLLTGTYTYLWADNSTNATRTVTTAGAYTVTISDGVCQVVSDTAIVRIDTFANVVLLPKDTNLCAGAFIAIYNQAQPLSQIAWSTGGTGTQIVVNSSGLYYVSVTNVNQCVAIDTVNVILNGVAPLVAFTGDTLCLGMFYTPANNSASQDTSSIASYNWLFGDGGNSNQTTPTHVYVQAGTFQVTLTATTSVGCLASTTGQVLVYANPTATIGSTPSSCVQIPHLFADNSIPAPSANINQWAWAFGDNTFASTQNPTHIYAAPNTYNVSLAVTDARGCADTATTVLQVVASAPLPAIPYQLSPTSNVVLASSAVKLRWQGQNASSYGVVVANNASFNNSTIYHTLADSLNIVLQSNQTYYWKVRSYNACLDSVESSVRSFTIFSPTDQPGLAVWLKADSLVGISGSQVATWGDGAGPVADNLSQATATLRPDFVANTGPLTNYQPALRFLGTDVLPGGTISGISDSSLSIYVVASTFAQPSSTFPGLITIGSNSTGYLMYKSTSQLAFTVDNTSTGRAQAPAGSMTTDAYPYRVFSSIKQRSVSLKAYINSDSVASSTSTAATGTFVNGDYIIGKTQGYGTWLGDISEVLIFRKALTAAERKNVEGYIYSKYAPPVDLGPDIKRTYGLCPVQIDAGPRFVKYLWSTGDTTQQVSVQVAGNYWVRTTDVFGRTSADTINVSLPFAGMSPQDTVLCLGNAVDVKPIIAAGQYYFSWNTGATTQGINVNTPGSYVLTITDDSACVVVADTVHVGVDSISLVSLLPTDTESCTGNILAIDGNGYMFSSITWSNGFTTPAITVGQAGIYTVTATTVNQCTVTDAIDVTIKGVAPTVDFSTNDACLHYANTFTDLSSTQAPDQISTWQWNYGDSTTIGTSPNTSHTYLLPGVYNVLLTVVTDSGCSASISKTATVFSLPSAGITQLAPICAQNSSRISGGVSIAPVGSAIASYQWQVGGNIVSSDTILRYNFPAQGIVPVTLVVATTQGCTDTTTRNIEIYAPFIADFEVDNVCVGDSSYFFDVTPSYSIVSRTWNFGDATSVVGTPTPTKKYNAAGTYDVTLVVTNAIGCRSTKVKQVIAAGKPTANFTNLTGCEDNFYKPIDASTSAQEPIDSWQWTIGGFNYNTQTPQRYFATPGSYPVKLIVSTATGCTDSIVKTTVIHARPTVNFSYTPLYGDAPLNVNFTSLSTGDSTYFWEFGDGGTSLLKNPAYTYTQNGEYNVKLTVVSPYGCTASRTKPYSVIKTDLDYAVNEAAVQITPLPNGSSLAKVSVIGSNIGTRIIDHISYYITLGGIGVIAEDWQGTLLSGQGILDTFSAQFVVPDGKGDSYICVTAVSVNNGQQELRTDNNSQCFGITEGIKLVGPLPNPAFNESKLGLILPKHGKVTLDITNMMGQYIVQAIELDLPEGRSDYELPVGQMTAGEYFIRILYNDEKIVRKFIISR